VRVALLPRAPRREPGVKDVEFAACTKVLAMLEAGPDARHPARELAAEAGPARQQPPQEQQQQSYRLADERGCLAGTYLAGDIVFLGTTEPRVPILQRYVARLSPPCFPLFPPSSHRLVLCARGVTMEERVYYSRA